MPDMHYAQVVFILLFAVTLMASVLCMTVILTVLRQMRLRRREISILVVQSSAATQPARFPTPSTAGITLIPERWHTRKPVVLKLEPDVPFMPESGSAQKLVDFLIQETVKKAS